jgi:hypothetical protein
MTIEIELTRGLKTRVSDEDAHLAEFSWFTQVTGYKGKHRYYATRRLESGKFLSMHRQITGVTERTQIVDHINGDSLDNRRENLRVGTHRQNLANRSAIPGRSSRWLGVHKRTENNTWRAQIKLNGKYTSLGSFADEGDAAMAYNAAALAEYGEFARLNAAPQPFLEGTDA